MSSVAKIAQNVIEGFKATSSTQEVDISGMPWKEVVAMQKIMLKSDAQLVFDVIEMGKGMKSMLVYKGTVAVSNVTFVDFKNKAIISAGRKK